jgi:hypothetical protein
MQNMQNNMQNMQNMQRKFIYAKYALALPSLPMPVELRVGGQPPSQAAPQARAQVGPWPAAGAVAAGAPARQREQ